MQRGAVETGGALLTCRGFRRLERNVGEGDLEPTSLPREGLQLRHHLRMRCGIHLTWNDYWAICNS